MSDGTGAVDKAREIDPTTYFAGAASAERPTRAYVAYTVGIGMLWGGFAVYYLVRGEPVAWLCVGGAAYMAVLTALQVRLYRRKLRKWRLATGVPLPVVELAGHHQVKGKLAAEGDDPVPAEGPA